MRTISFWFILFLSTWASAAELECVTLTTPLEGSTDSPTSTIIRWTSQDEAIGYEVSIGSSPFENDILEQKIYTDTFTEQLDLPPNTTIYVIIIPFSNTQFTVGCEQFTFTTAPDCEHYVNPIAEASLCYASSDETFVAVVDFNSFQKLEKELIGDQNGLEITFFNSDDVEVDLRQVNLIADDITYQVRAEVKGIDDCIKETSFTLTLLKLLEVDKFDDVVTCENYQLPELSPKYGYYSELGGTRMELQAGTLITMSQAIFVYAVGNGCVNESSFKVNINVGNCEQQVSTIDYPKFFTPNGDGINDLWKPLQSETPNAQGSPVFIYDRNGKLVYQLNFDTLGWDGKFNGKTLPSSDYWFVVTLDKNNSFNGHFALRR